MGKDYVIFYIEASAVCILILLIIWINDRIYRTQQEKQIWFSRAIVSFILYFVSDACWASVLGGVLPRTRPLVFLFNATNYVLMSAMAYAWFMFMAAAEKMAFRNSRRKTLQWLLPMVVSILGIGIAYILDPLFWISESCEVNGLYQVLLIATPTVYLLFAFVFSARNARKAQAGEDRKLYWLIGIFPLSVMAVGLLQVVYLNAPTFCFGCTVMLLFFYIQNMQTLISVDALTRLNNRGQINRYMEQVRYRESTRTYFMMFDIDRFKQINDTYGHAEGDRVLVLVAKAFKKTCESIKSPVFLGRYGGDEFTLIIQNPSENEHPDQIAKTLRSVLREEGEKNRLPFVLEISVGYDELRNGKDTMHDCMIRADEKLYADKRERGSLR